MLKSWSRTTITSPSSRSLKRQPKRQSAEPVARTVVTHYFKLAFIGMLLLTVLLYVGAGLLSILSTGHPEIAKVADGFLDGGKICTGATAGLLSGKALR